MILLEFIGFGLFWFIYVLFIVLFMSGVHFGILSAMVRSIGI